MKKVLDIRVVMPTINHPERLKLEGLLTYAHEQKGSRWQIRLEYGSSFLPDGGHRPDGLIIYVTTPDERVPDRYADIPTVFIEDVLQPKVPSLAQNTVTLLCNHESEGRTAAQYFLERHFTNFAFIGTSADPEWCQARLRGYRNALSERVFVLHDEKPSEIADFLKSLPQPCAIFCAHDLLARTVLAAANTCGIGVPDKLAILGVDDDRILCTTVAPALSSIPSGDFRIGSAAGRCLEELLTGRSRGGRLIEINRTHVVSRRSTDADALADPLVADTLVYARTHLDGNLELPALARRLNHSTRLLQLRTDKALGHSLSEEIRRIRLNAALERLRHSDRPVLEIALSCGFTSASHLSTRVKEATGLTPLAYRKKT